MHKGIYRWHRAASNDMKFLIHFYLKHKNGPHTAGKYAAVYILPQRAVNKYILLSMLSILCYCTWIKVVRSGAAGATWAFFFRYLTHQVIVRDSSANTSDW